MIERFEERGGGITDETLIGLVGTAFDEGRRGHETSDVLARGRQLRRRKRAVPALGAIGVLAASAGIALTPTGPNTAAGTPAASGDHTPVANGSTVNMDTASFSVHTDAKTGTVAVTVRQSSHEDELKQILAEAGIRVVFNPRCDGPGIKDLNIVGVITRPLNLGGRVFIIDPSKMPSGSVLDFSYTPGPYEPYNGIGVGLLSGEPTGACAPS